ncbi:aspartate kinase [Sesbania bispinosa]|nr:aspartate kinase [Sesbania bispinosa]
MEEDREAVLKEDEVEDSMYYNEDDSDTSMQNNTIETVEDLELVNVLAPIHGRPKVA